MWQFFDEIDLHRARRIREISTLKVLCSYHSPTVLSNVLKKSFIVGCYGHWEGFYNECVDAFVSAAIKQNLEVKDVSWSLMVGVFESDLRSVKDRNHSRESHVELIESLRTKSGSKFDRFDRTCIKSRSNLNFETIRKNFNLLDVDCSGFERFRLKIDRELVGWRHSIAHGDEIDMSLVDIKTHADLTSELLILVSNLTQQKMLSIWR